MTLAFSRWDWHGGNFKRAREDMPMLDQALTALVEDLQNRGMDKDVSVVCWGEFGRTPKINKGAGRDHWPWVYSLALAGAGVNEGTIYGASDESAAYPAANPHDPCDFVATLYHLMGVPPQTKIYDALGRPHNVVIGRPIEPILA